ncbi:MAG TPA: FtsQ-type POTRA domain-containing protein [Micromonosporaceae bacterium]
MTDERARGARRWRLVRAGSQAIPSSVRRFNQRRRARRLSSARPWLIAAGVLALAGVATFVVYGTSMLGVSHITVVGNGPVHKADVRTAAAVAIGTPLASVDLSKVGARVETLIGVRSAKVRRDWPRTLVIEVTPRTAIVAVPDGKAYRLVDSSGVAFQTVSAQPELPLLQVTSPGPDDSSTMSALAVLGSLPKSIRDQLVRIKAPSSASVTLYLINKREVIWGDSSDNAAKGRVAVSLLKRPGTVIDVSAPNVVTVR